MRSKRLAAGALAAVMLAGYAITPELKDAFVVSASAAEGDVAINATNFPDAIFREYVSTNFDDGDGVLTQAECDDVTVIDVSGSVDDLGSISSLKGIEHFKKLKELNCKNNALTSFDITNNTALEGLRFTNNGLTTIDVSKNTKLKVFEGYGNKLASLDVSCNPELKVLDCYSNRLSSLDISNNTALEELWCGNNQLSSIDLSKNTKLKRAFIDYNQLTSLDISKNTELSYLDLGNNKLTALNTSANTALTSLWCWGNQLTSLDLSNNKKLTQLYLGVNQLSSIDVSNNTALKEFVCASNQLSSLDVSKNTQLTFLNCSSNMLSSIDVSNNTLLNDFDCNSNQISTLDLSHNDGLLYLYCESNKLTSLDVSKKTELLALCCSRNGFTSLDLSNNPALDFLTCSNNKLTSLDVSKNPMLTTISCGFNSLTSLDVSKNTVLTMLDCVGNQLTSLDVSKNTVLETLGCDQNRLTSLNLRNNSALTRLYTDNDITIYGISGSYAEAYANESNVKFVALGSTEKIEAFAERLYTKLLNRASDPVGLADWTNKLMSGKTAAEVAYGFLFSKELLESGISNEEFVTRMYETFLGRSPDPVGLADWVGALDNGCSIGLIANGFVQSKEFAAICADAGITPGYYEISETRDANRNLTAFVSRMYTKALKRSYDPIGINDWTNRYLNEGAKVEDIAYGFIFSQEFLDKNLSDEDYVETLYETFFNRPSDEVGRNDWLDRMHNKGYERIDVLYGFVGSQECIDLVASFGI